jgi:ribosomal protein S18 acetylase RimI-like enzyme
VAGALSPPEPLNAAHELDAFASSNDQLNDWLKRRALANEGRTSRTYVVALGKRVVGYYTLASGGVARATLPKRLQRGTPDTIPVVVLGRLATDRAFEGRGIGRAMLREAVARTIAAAEEIGVRCLIVHAIDDAALGFYLRNGFLVSPLEARTAILPVDTALGALRGK